MMLLLQMPAEKHRVLCCVDSGTHCGLLTPRSGAGQQHSDAGSLMVKLVCWWSHELWCGHLILCRLTGHLVAPVNRRLHAPEQCTSHECLGGLAAKVSSPRTSQQVAPGLEVFLLLCYGDSKAVWVACAPPGCSQMSSTLPSSCILFGGTGSRQCQPAAQAEAIALGQDPGVAGGHHLEQGQGAQPQPQFCRAGVSVSGQHRPQRRSFSGW